MHALGDYPALIPEIGSADGYSTCDVRASAFNAIANILQGEHEHIRVKAHYARTNKKEHEKQIALHEQKQRLLHNIGRNTTTQQSLSSVIVDAEILGLSDPNVHYHIAKSQKFHFDS